MVDSCSTVIIAICDCHFLYCFNDYFIVIFMCTLLFQYYHYQIIVIVSDLTCLHTSQCYHAIQFLPLFSIPTVMVIFRDTSGRSKSMVRRQLVVILLISHFGSDYLGIV